MLEAKNLTFSYPGGTQRFSYDLTALAGEVTTIYGPSGSGKSTLFDLLAGFANPNAGDILLDGTTLLKQSPDKRPVTILFQSDNLFEHLSARQNVEIGQKGNRDVIREQTEAALQQVGLLPQANQKVSTLSGGQQQRVGLARAISRGRKILLLDEPFAALDDKLASDMRQLVKSLTTQNQWITLVISHHPDDRSSDFADRVYALSDGVLSLA